MADVFISYDSEDRAIAEKIARGLTSAGYSVWWDRHIQAGVRFKREIQRQIDSARAVVVLWSAASADSDWVGDEAQVARDANKLIPVRIDTTLPPLGFRQVQALDLQSWNGDTQAGTFQALLSSLHRLLDDPAAASIDATHHEAPAASRKTPKTRWFVAAAAAIAVSVLAFVFLQTRTATRTTSEANDGRVEIGVFEPVTKTDELERFAKGLQDTVVRVLATNGIKAVRPTRIDEANPLTANSEFVLRGTVDREREQLVVNAELVHRREGLVLWSTMKQRDAARSRILENQLAESVGVMLLWGQQLRCAARNDPSVELLSRFIGFAAAFVDGRSEQLPDLAQRIVEIAPDHAVSFALRATANAIVSNPAQSYIDKPANEVAQLRRMVYEDARTAEEMDSSVDSYFARAIVDDPTVGFAAREQLLKKSIDLASNFRGRNEYGGLLVNVGRIHDALNQFERAGIIPFDWPSALEAALVTGWTGNMELARKRFDDVRREHSEPLIDYKQFWTELFFGDAAIAKRIAGTYDSRWIGSADATLGHDACGRMLMGALEQGLRLGKTEIDASCPGGDQYAYGYFGYVDDALRLWESNPLSWRWMVFVPGNRLLRADPRFMQLAARFGLVDYWLDTDRWPDFCKEEKLPYDCKEAALAARANALGTSPRS